MTPVEPAGDVYPDGHCVHVLPSVFRYFPASQLLGASVNDVPVPGAKVLQPAAPVPTVVQPAGHTMQFPVMLLL